MSSEQMIRDNVEVLKHAMMNRGRRPDGAAEQQFSSAATALLEQFLVDVHHIATASRAKYVKMERDAFDHGRKPLL